MRTLLVLGAGGHGRVVKEVATSLGYEVLFLDDKLEQNVVGRLNEANKFKDRFDAFFVGIGNNKMRGKLQDELSMLGGSIATLISPLAIVSPSAIIGAGTIVEPGAIINTRVRIGKGCIVSVGSIIDHDSVLEDFSHLNTGAICMSGAHVEKGQKVEAGSVVHGLY